MRKLTMALALAAAAACAGQRAGQRPDAVSDADFGRLGPEQLGPVDEGRRFLATARDEQARAQLRLHEAQHEGDLAKADEQAARADAERAAAQAKVADDSREPAQLEQARLLQERGQLHQAAAEAHGDYAKKLAEARQAAVKAADQQVALGEARVEWSKLQALQQAQVPAAGKYDPARFQARITEAQRAFDEGLRAARDRDAQAASARQRWDDLQRQVQARGGAAVPTG